MTVPRITDVRFLPDSYGKGWTGVRGTVVGRSDTVAA